MHMKLDRRIYVLEIKLLKFPKIFLNHQSGPLSKKLLNLFICSEVNEYCKLNIEMVKGRMASPSVLASADFPGVLELLQSMNNQ